MLRAVAQRGTVLGQTGLPVIVPSTSTTGIQANGTLTVDTALAMTYPQAWCYFPAGAVSGDATGGLYYCVFSSTTQGTVYAGKIGGANGVSSTFTPYVPTTLTPVVGSGAGYTQSTGKINVLQVVVPGGSMGPEGSLNWQADIATNNNANSKTSYYDFSTGSFSGNNLASLTFTRINRWAANRGVVNSQYVTPIPTATSTTAPALPNTTINTAVSQPFVLAFQLAVATDWMAVEFFNLQVYYGS